MKRLLLLLCLIPLQTAAKVLIITHSFNRPDFIELHLKTFNAFLQDSYEYVVFNDADQEDMKRHIEETCKRCGVRCFRVPQHMQGRQSAGTRHMDGIKYALEKVGYDHDGVVALVDSDMFLIKPFSIEKYLEGYDIAGDLQGRGNNTIEVRYLSPALVFMNMQTLPNRRTLSFEGGYIEGLGCDVGGHTYYYLKNNPSVRPSFFGVLHIGVWKVGLNCRLCSNMTCVDCTQRLRDSGFDDMVIKYIQACPDNIEFNLNHSFLHYRGGSNWDHKSAEYHCMKTRALNDFMSAIVQAQKLSKEQQN